MEKSWLKSSDIKFVIISRGRANSIISHLLFPYATLVVCESEYELYKEKVKDIEIDTVPDNIKGLGLLRNCILNKYKENIIIMLDDDIERLVSIDDMYIKTFKDTEDIKQILINTAQCAKDLGTNVFGFGQTADIRKYYPCEPFSLYGWVGGVIGIIGKEQSFIDNMFKVDIDFCLETLLHKRVIFKDERFVFVQKRDRNSGGNALFRNTELVDQEKKKLKNKWGKYINFSSTKMGESCSLNVKRREQYIL